MSQINESAIKTPGVYINEIPSFPPSVAQVATAIPAFIGYTEKAMDSDGTSLNMKAKRITSMVDYELYFGKAPKEVNIEINISEVHINGGLADVKVSAAISGSPSSVYMMYYAMRMFFLNGGSACYIISVDTYTTGTGSVAQARLLSALDVLEKEDEPTLIVFPDGQNITSAAQYKTLVDSSLALCGKLQDRFAIIDVLSKTWNINTDQNEFRSNNVSNDNLSYGACYYPNLVTTLSYDFNDADVVLNISVEGGGAAILASATLDTMFTENSAVYAKCKNAITQLGVEIAPSSAMAGIMSRVDGTRGVWKAPANVSVLGVKSLTVTISDADQETLNIDATSGKSINAIRAFIGKGKIVWGARTLDGNSNEWRYVSVRRFFNMVEESCKKASAQFVFEPNDANTWIKIRAMIENYLTILWRQGALAGAKPEHAFFVKIGLGQTMTAIDILEGRLIVEIGLAAVRPAEFIILRFMHKMQES